MADKTVKSVREVGNLDKLAKHITNENDLVSTEDGVVYVVTKNGYKQITNDVGSSDVSKLQQDIKNVKSENTKLKNRLSELETQNETLAGRLDEIEANQPDPDPEPEQPNDTNESGA